MTKLTVALTSLLLLFAMVSCQPEVDLSGANNASVHIISVALDYRNAFEESKDMFGASGVLKGTVYDAVELTYCLSDIYNETGVKHDVTYMVAYGESASEKYTTNYPSAQNILNVVNDLRTNPQDLVIFIFAGHADAPYNQEAFFCTGKIENPGPDDEESYTKLFMKDLYAALENKNCSCLAILDTCYAGSLLNWDQTQQYMDQAVVKFLNQDEFSNISILASSQAYETSHNELQKYNAESQEHGYFTLALLDTLGWDHDVKGQNVRFESFGQSGVLVNGKVKNVPKSMTVEDLYNGVNTRWAKVTEGASAGARYQAPTRSFTHSIFVPIPYSGLGTPTMGKTFASNVIAIVNGKGYTDIQKAVDAITKNGEPNPIYIVADVPNPDTPDHWVHVDTSPSGHTPVEINFGPYGFMPYLYAEGGGEIYIHGKTEEEFGNKVMVRDKTKVYFDDIQKTEYYTQFGIQIILPDPHKALNN